MHKRMIRETKRDWNAAFNYVYKFLNNSNLPELICHFKVQLYQYYVMYTCTFKVNKEAQGFVDEPLYCSNSTWVVKNIEWGLQPTM